MTELDVKVRDVEEPSPNGWAALGAGALGFVGMVWRVVYSRRSERRFVPDPSQTWRQALALIDRQRERVLELEGLLARKDQEIADLRRFLEIEIAWRERQLSGAAPELPRQT